MTTFITIDGVKVKSGDTLWDLVEDPDDEMMINAKSLVFRSDGMRWNVDPSSRYSSEAAALTDAKDELERRVQYAREQLDRASESLSVVNERLAQLTAQPLEA